MILFLCQFAGGTLDVLPWHQQISKASKPSRCPCWMYRLLTVLFCFSFLHYIFIYSNILDDINIRILFKPVQGKSTPIWNKTLNFPNNTSNFPNNTLNSLSEFPNPQNISNLQFQLTLKTSSTNMPPLSNSSGVPVVQVSEPTISSPWKTRLRELTKSQTKPLLTLFTSWIDDKDKYLVHNLTTLNWLSLRPFVMPIVFTNEISLATVCERAGWVVLPLRVASTDGIPVLKYMYIDAMRRVKSNFYAYSNSDILFTDTLVDTLIEILENNPRSKTFTQNNSRSHHDNSASHNFTQNNSGSHQNNSTSHQDHSTSHNSTQDNSTSHISTQDSSSHQDDSTSHQDNSTSHQDNSTSHQDNSASHISTQESSSHQDDSTSHQDNSTSHYFTQNNSTSQHHILIVGRRTNVFNITMEEGSSWSEVTAVAKKRGELFITDAEDYFITSPSYPWNDIPEIVIGRRAYDNWLVVNARKQKHQVIDATSTILAVHQTTKHGNFEGMGKKNRDYNHNLLASRYKSLQYGLGITVCTEYQTTINAENISITFRNLPKYCEVE
ncbi:hypothetical protein ACJMK2_010651 [Sinanodonta woodiana]|uniref:Uncharacterized protein n=1 Tax=Sinanodonta woodiana TaxID=1069815 RepID=A0ABD3VGC2_SINWO